VAGIIRLIISAYGHWLAVWVDGRGGPLIKLIIGAYGRWLAVWVDGRGGPLIKLVIGAYGRWLAVWVDGRGGPLIKQLTVLASQHTFQTSMVWFRKGFSINFCSFLALLLIFLTAINSLTRLLMH